MKAPENTEQLQLFKEPEQLDALNFKAEHLIAKLSPQLQVKLCLKAELALVSTNPATHPPTPARESLFSNIFQ